jgi:hypothetical protein
LLFRHPCSRQRIPRSLRSAHRDRPQAARTLPGVTVFRTCEIRDRGGCLPILRGGGVSPICDGSSIGTRRFTTASPLIRLAHSTGGSQDYEACGDSPAFTRPVFPSPAITGWNSNGFGFYPGLRTPRLPAAHAKAGTVPRTLDRVMPSTMEPPDNMTTHNVRLHVAPSGSGSALLHSRPLGTGRADFLRSSARAGPMAMMLVLACCCRFSGGSGRV